MIGNGIAALASTTALAPAGGHARGSAGSDAGFAQTLDQAIKQENAGASGKGETQAPETTPATPDVGRRQQGDFLAAARWRNVAGEEPASEAGEAAAEESVAEQTGSDTEIVETAMSPEAPAGDAPIADQDALDAAGNGEADATPSAESATVDVKPVAAAADSSEPAVSEEDDGSADEAPKDSGRADGVSPAEVQAAATDAGDKPSERKAGETAAASVETGRARKSGSPDQAGSRPADGAQSVPVTGDGDSKTAVRNQGEAVSAKGDLSAASSNAGVSTASAAPQANAPVRSPELKPDTPANTGGKAEPAVAVDAALDRASKSTAATAQTNTAPAPLSAADKPVQTSPVLQMTQPSATSGTTSPAGQVADAVARDLEQLAPTRVVVTANGAANRSIRSMQLQLNPAELGTVNIRLHSVDGQLHVAIRAESDKTAEMLSRDSDAIRSALRAAGISSSEVTVSVNRNDQTPQQFTGQNRDTSGQFAGQDNRGNMSNESRNPNREAQSGNPHGPLGRGNADSGDADGNDRLFI